MIIKNVKNKTTIAAIIVILMLTFSTVATISTVAAQKTSFGMSFMTDALVGVNSPTLISWIPTIALEPGFIVSPGMSRAHPILHEGPYAGQTSIWPDAVVTLTRPDGSTDVVNGPFKMRPDAVQGRVPDIVLIYTPNVMGEWTVNFYWPGDDSYNAVDATNTFTVGEHFEKRATYAKLSMRPYPAVGLGQPLLINAWVTPPPINYRGIYEDYMFTFTSPSGSSFEVGPMHAEGPATVWFDIPLTEIGEWTIKFDFPGDYFDLASSVTRTITVQEEIVPVGYPDIPLPTQSWTFPINTQNREWRNIAGPVSYTHLTLPTILLV